MAVYIDDSKNRYKGMIMSHVIADSHSELMSFADEIGIERRHIQYEGTRKEHFDICQSYKTRAIKKGLATEIPKRELVTKMNGREFQYYDY